MAEPAASSGSRIVYLEPEDEIPSVIRRVREAGGNQVILVASGRTKALSSVIALRLLARAASADGVQVALVADAATRAMASEAGVSGFATLREAEGDGSTAGPATGAAASAMPAEAPARPRASIRVVRGDRPRGSRAPVAAAAITQTPVDGLPAEPVAQPRPYAPGPVTRSSVGDETRPIPIAPTLDPRTRRRGRPTSSQRAAPLTALRTINRSALLAIAAAVAVAAAALAAVVPAATIHITPRTQAAGPFEYLLTAPVHSDAGLLDLTVSGTATGTHVESIPAKGIVVFSNYRYVVVEVPKGTRLVAGTRNFTTDQTILVPPSLVLDQPGMASAPVTALVPGPDGNVGADAIDTVDDRKIVSRLWPYHGRAPRLVINPNPLTGGTSTTTPEVTQKDVEAAHNALQAEAQQMLDQQLATHQDRVYVPPETPEQATVTVPAGLVGTRGQETFDLSGTLAYARDYALRADLLGSALAAIHADTKAIPSGQTLLDESVGLVPDDVSVSGGRVAARSRVTAQSVPAIDTQSLKSEVAGLSAAEATARLEVVGTPRIEFWPGWVTAIPRIGFRVEIVIEPPSAPSARLGLSGAAGS